MDEEASANNRELFGKPTEIMIARQIKLIHFRSARDLALELDSRLNVFIGENGAGKTTVLDALSILLSWCYARLRSPNSKGLGIRDLDIRSHEIFAWIELTCKANNNASSEISWSLFQILRGRNRKSELANDNKSITNFAELNDWSSEMRGRIGENNENFNIPLFVYYPVDRGVSGIPLRIRKRPAFGLLDAYDGALSGGSHFRSFFEWYRNREDIDNEQYRAANEDGNGKLEFVEDSQLKAVREAILSFLPGFSRISIRRNPLRMEVLKDGNPLRIDQMSDGEKLLFAMIGDLARRLAIANPTTEKPLLGAGIVLIDEIELHLHPAWQRSVVQKLLDTFPNCQFIVTTHSPQVIGEVDAKNVRKLSVDAVEGIQCRTPAQTLGLDSNDILEELMETSSRRKDVDVELSTIFDLIDRDEFAEAKYRISELKTRLNGSIPELLRAESLMVMLTPEEESRA